MSSPQFEHMNYFSSILLLLSSQFSTSRLIMRLQLRFPASINFHPFSISPFSSYLSISFVLRHLLFSAIPQHVLFLKTSLTMRHIPIGFITIFSFISTFAFSLSCSKSSFPCLYVLILSLRSLPNLYGPNYFSMYGESHLFPPTLPIRKLILLRWLLLKILCWKRRSLLAWPSAITIRIQVYQDLVILIYPICRRIFVHYSPMSPLGIFRSFRARKGRYLYLAWTSYSIFHIFPQFPFQFLPHPPIFL